jgi:hypothetical protein
VKILKNVPRWASEQVITIKTEVNVWPSVVIDYRVQIVDQNICGNSTISELLCEFPHNSHIIIVRISYHKLYTTGVQKMLVGVHKRHRMASFFFNFQNDITKTAIISVTLYE